MVVDPRRANDIAIVEFRMIVFRPFKGETILGKISSATPEGIHSMFILFWGDRPPLYLLQRLAGEWKEVLLTDLLPRLSSPHRVLRGDIRPLQGAARKYRVVSIRPSSQEVT